MAALIYDKECPYCRAVSLAATGLSDVDIIEYGSKEAREMVEAAFDDPGFTLYLFENNRVYWGREVARRIFKRVGLPARVSMPFIRLYPEFVRLFSAIRGRSSFRQPVCGSDRCMATEESGGMMRLKRNE